LRRQAASPLHLLSTMDQASLHQLVLARKSDSVWHRPTILLHHAYHLPTQQCLAKETALLLQLPTGPANLTGNGSEMIVTATATGSQTVNANGTAVDLVVLRGRPVEESRHRRAGRLLVAQQHLAAHLWARLLHANQTCGHLQSMTLQPEALGAMTGNETDQSGQVVVVGDGAGSPEIAGWLSGWVFSMSPCVGLELSISCHSE